jgi:hypothetical protein
MARRKDVFARAYLVFSALALAALVVITVFLVLRDAANVAAQHDSNVQQCRLANTARQQDIAIWNRITAVLPSATAAERSFSADLRRLARVKDAPRNCTAAYRQP